MEKTKSDFIDVAPFIWYAGRKANFVGECDTIDEAQAMIDRWKIRGGACALHKNDRHQVYAYINWEAIGRQNPNTDFTICEKCGNHLESDICDDCGYDHSL